MDDTKLAPPTAEDAAWLNAAAGRAAYTEAARQSDIIHISLAGMTMIVLVLLFALSLPVFGGPPVSQLFAFLVMVAAAMCGIGGLYYMNYRVHQHVSTQARLTEVLVNSLGQGFLSFNALGLCGPVYSQACLDLLQVVPAGQNIADVLRIAADKRADFKDWLEVLFLPNHALGFDDVVRFLPQFFPHSKGRQISLLYRPIRDNAGLLVAVVVIATDRTEEYEAQLHAQEQQNFADMICRIFKERNQFLAIVTQVRKFIQMNGPSSPAVDPSTLLRTLHTLKASVKHFHLDALGNTVQKLEQDLRGEALSEAQFKHILAVGQKEIQTHLDAVMNQVHDLIGQDYEGRGNLREIEESALYDFARVMKARHADPDLIQRYLVAIAAVPINECFRPFERELNDLAEIIGKQVKPVRYTGSNPHVLTQDMQEFFVSLTHICRNIMDHGIEPSVTRLARGKPPAGQVSVHTDLIPDSVTGKQWLHIIISDDGGGIDPARVRAKLATTDPQGAWRTEDDQTVIQRIFSWGFSTRENVNDLSGRGVGLEAVEREVQLLGGKIKVYSELYHGARFDIRIPYSLNLDEHQSPPSSIAS